jgi:hypothetical protein
MAYVWPDGTPRVIPIWFHWTGEEIILCSPPGAPKMKALGMESSVSLTIDTESWPAKALLIRGVARTSICEGEIPEYGDIASKYLGNDADAWRDQYSRMFPRQARIAVRPQWVAILDVAAGRLPSAIEAAKRMLG